MEACFAQCYLSAVLAPSTPSAGVIYMKEQDLVAQKGVGVVKFEQVDAFAWIIMAACLHVTVAVPPIHRHDLTIAVSQIALGAPFHISNWGES